VARARLVAGLVLVMAPWAFGLAADAPPILQITIEPIRPGKEAEYGSIEEDLATLCARLGCPNRYLALLSVDAPREVWWLVAYESQAEVERVAAGYANNQPLLDAMSVLTAKKDGLAEAPTERWTKHRADLSDAAPWQIGATRFVVIATSAARGGAIFETADEQRFAIAGAETGAAATEAAARLGPSARTFEVRPTWSQPAEEWTMANPDLWMAR
jgi:hypothetical protein